MDKRKKLQVNDLKISFRTNNGRVQAVRNISFDLYEGETLAIVGESGSGKSVTSRAIMGILAPNAIVESGKILYDGKDLLQISEDDFHEIRGDKIAMVFQDPLSSLNPIVKIGKQLTEAMILKNKITRKVSKRTLKNAWNILRDNINVVFKEQNNLDKIKTNENNINIFKNFVNKYIALNDSYETAVEKLGYAVNSIVEAKQILENAMNVLAIKAIKEAEELILSIDNGYLFKDNKDDIINDIKALTVESTSENKTVDSLLSKIYDILPKLEKIANQAKPNFFSLAYCIEYNLVPEYSSYEELNQKTREILDEKFMLEFIRDLELGVKNCFDTCNENKKIAITKLTETLNKFKEYNELDKKTVENDFNALYPYIEKCINSLRIGKDSYTATFKSTINKQIVTYFSANKVNLASKKKYLKEKANFDKVIAAGKTPKYTVSEPNYIDKDLAKANIIDVIEQLIEVYNKEIENYELFNVNEYTIKIIDYLKELSANTVKKVSKRSAKERALKIMDEVGIPEPKKRFNQYPFQFSGGMRQRIIIAIALSADPDILICDEPTTALDVTIQAQILELINNLKAKKNLSIIFITHDLGVVANMANRIAVMYAGKIVEHGLVDEVFYDPKHPYTWALLASMPDLETKEKLSPIPGTPPDMIYPPKGDAFAARNKYAMKIDFEKQPPLFKVTDTHYAATWLLHPNAPKTNPPSIVTERIERMLKANKEVSDNE